MSIANFDKKQFDEVRGKWDCEDGVPHKPHQSAAYSQGYAEEYAVQQTKTEHTRMKNEHRSAIPK